MIQSTKFALQKMMEPERENQLNHVNPALIVMVKKLGVKIHQYVFMIQSTKFALQKMMEPERENQLNHVNPALNVMVKKLGVKIPRHVFMIQSTKFALQKMMEAALLICKNLTTIASTLWTKLQAGLKLRQSAMPNPGKECRDTWHPFTQRRRMTL